MLKIVNKIMTANMISRSPLQWLSLSNLIKGIWIVRCDRTRLGCTHIKLTNICICLGWENANNIESPLILKRRIFASKSFIWYISWTVSFTEGVSVNSSIVFKLELNFYTTDINFDWQILKESNKVNHYKENLAIVLTAIKMKTHSRYSSLPP